MEAKEYIASISGATNHPSVDQFNDQLSKIYRCRGVKTNHGKRRKSHNLSRKSKRDNSNGRLANTSYSVFRKPRNTLKPKFSELNDK
mmetsp:Transcript_1127/g.1020  ORF Transcript_1127/g.1020 Transcript_1127/m.1020 type:complete len:87 (+) Transcript_1127:359-619(+)